MITGDTAEMALIILLIVAFVLIGVLWVVRDRE